jgi:hypothetical protein
MNALHAGGYRSPATFSLHRTSGQIVGLVVFDVPWLVFARPPVGVRPPNVPFKFDPKYGPGGDWIWKGSGPPGSGQGNWVNPKTGEWLRSDQNHLTPVGPHNDYGIDGKTYRWFGDGILQLKTRSVAPVDDHLNWESCAMFCA